MAEPKSETEDETVTSGTLKEIKSETIESEVATIESEERISTDYKSTKVESETDEGSRTKKPLVDKGADKVNS